MKMPDLTNKTVREIDVKDGEVIVLRFPKNPNRPSAGTAIMTITGLWHIFRRFVGDSEE